MPRKLGMHLSLSTETSGAAPANPTQITWGDGTEVSWGDGTLTTWSN